MTTPTPQPSPRELLARARDVAPSVELREVLQAVLDEGLDRLFEVRTAGPSELVVAFGSKPALWILARGEAYMERRSSQGRTLRPRCVRAGSAFGVFPGAHDRALPPLVDNYVRAVTAVATVVLPHDGFDELLRRCPRLEPVLAFLDLRERISEIAEMRLRAFPGVTFLPIETLVGLLERGRRVFFARGAQPVVQGETSEAFYVVLEGIFTQRREHGGETIERTAGPGQILAAASVIADVPAIESSIAASDTLCLAVSKELWRELLAANPQARRGAETLLPEDAVDLVLLQSDVPGAPLPELTALVARGVREDFGDNVLIVRIAAGPKGPPSESRDACGNTVLTVHVPPGDPVPAALRAALDPYSALPELLVFLDPTSAHLEAAVPVLSRVAWLTRGSHTAPPAPFCFARVDRAALLAPVGDRSAHVWPTRTVRLRLDFDRVRRLVREPSPLASCADAAHATTQGIRRWGRALTDRLVGLALGGGGSPGFAHIALIRAIEDRLGLPIDLVAGTSFGALVGAWYAGVRQLDIQEPERLKTMLEAGRKLNVCLTIGMLDTRPLANLVDGQFDGLRLSDLEMPFFPVSSEVDSGTVYVGRGESLGSAVQMSGAFPPFFPPVVRGPNTRLVDGGFVNNVPASVLRTEGASFVIASNSIGLIPPREVPTSRRRQLVQALNPMGRIEDAVRAAMMLFHRIGDAQSTFADAAFDSQYTGFAFWDFNRGQEVIDQVDGLVKEFVDRVGAGIRISRDAGSGVRAFGALA